MQIRSRQVEQSLETVERRLAAILDDNASRVIGQAKSELRVSKCQYVESQRQGRRERPVRPWGFSIEPNDPLRFKVTEVGGLRLWVDLSLQAYWDCEPAEQPAQLGVLIRVWCLDQNIYFRRKWDAPTLEDKVDRNTGRVMLRIHFDLANESQPGPRYHVQVGGRQHPAELHWFPETISVPRMLHMPVDLVLARELVAANFYPNEYKSIRREPSWRGSRRVSQEHLLHRYFDEAMAAVNDNDSVLEALWNIPLE